MASSFNRVERGRSRLHLSTWFNEPCHFGSGGDAPVNELNLQDHYYVWGLAFTAWCKLKIWHAPDIKCFKYSLIYIADQSEIENLRLRKSEKVRQSITNICVLFKKDGVASYLPQALSNERQKWKFWSLTACKYQLSHCDVTMVCECPVWSLKFHFWMCGW